ncbi:MAG TPA: DNA primase [Phycisphaerae bacterium]|nr:DNA primase [Phycisphaerae bacterium]HRY68554.1 DNA primase [Phycisphaerae bacterium]HSA25602.1 DNA primase [Phycisphaerae bacterium]
MPAADRETITRQIRDSLSIVDVVSGYMTLRRAGASFKGLCPFHEEKTPSFMVNPARQTFKCFGCGAGGDLFTFVQLKEKVDFVEARRMLAERAGISLEFERLGGTTSSGPGKSDLVRVNDWAQQFFRRQYAGPGGEVARQYVAKRGLTDRLVEDFGLGYAADSFDGLIQQAKKAGIEPGLLQAAGLVKERERGGSYDAFRHRLMFPIHDVTGRLIAFGGRTLADDPAKYLNTAGTMLFDKSSSLFGIERAKHAAAKAGRMIVVEGYTDCMMAHQFGFTEAVATLGTAMTEAHAALLRRYTDRVILVFDSDEAGQRAAERAVSVTLLGGLEVMLAKVPEGKDPCDYLLAAGGGAFEEVLKNAVSALEFRWHQVVRQYEAGTTGPGRRRAIEAYLQELAAWTGRGVIDPIQRGLLVNQLSKILGLRAEDLHHQLNRMAQRFRRPLTAAVSGVSGEGEKTGLALRLDAEQRALWEIVEVLLNAPELYGRVAGKFEAELIADASVCRVARALVEVMSPGGAFRLAEFIGRFESTEFAQLITDLQAAGEQMGDYEDVLNRALASLESCARLRETHRLAESIRQKRAGTEGEPAGEEEDERLRALAAGIRQTHFAPAGARRKFLLQ